ncbi:MAG: tetratricopeptide repeat protein [Bryobacteraceae bacterium]
MTFRRMAYTTVLFALALPIIGQQQAQQPSSQQQGPKPKSQKESDALKKVLTAQQAKDWDGEIQAINYVLETFADTEYKPLLLNMAMQAAQQKNDYPQTVIYGERAVQADPNNILSTVMLAEVIASHTRENDLDKEQSLKKSEDYANKALDLIKNSNAPPPGVAVPADQWPQYKKDLSAQAHDSLGQVAVLRKNYPQAIEYLKTAVSEAAHPDGATMDRLGKAYLDSKQYDDAIATADKVLAMNDAPPVVKQFAQQTKDQATKLKSANK